MPTYDVECSGCGFSTTAVVKIADLADWDRAASCPSCQAERAQFRRVIKQAPITHGGPPSVGSQLASQKDRFVRSGDRDAMRHEASKRTDRNQIAAARESVKRGEFEGF